jgi:hypothetical protein
MAPNSITVTANEIITSALQEIGALAAGESAPIQESADVLKKLQRLIDRMNARMPMVYNVNFVTYTLQVNHTPTSIGPGGDFDVNQRPVDILSIGLFLNDDPAVQILLNKRDQQWWASQTIQKLTSTLPTDFYYSPDWPLGNIYFWPVPTSVHDVLVQSRLVLGEYTSYAQNFTMPPAYWDAIVYQLAVSLCPMYEREPSATLLDMEKRAIKAIQVNNMQSPRLSSDAPSSRGVNEARPDFNFLTGLSQ